MTYSAEKESQEMLKKLLAKSNALDQKLADKYKIGNR